MKKGIVSVMALFVLVSGFSVLGCGDDDPEHTDPSFLIGTWRNGGGTEFAISADYTFVCSIEVPLLIPPQIDMQYASEETNMASAKLSGRLDFDKGGLGPNDYCLRDLERVDEGSTYTEGNDAMFVGSPNRLTQFTIYNLVFTLKPNTARTEFVFSTVNLMANAFFTGNFAYATYTNVTP